MFVFSSSRHSPWLTVFVSITSPFGMFLVRSPVIWMTSALRWLRPLTFHVPMHRLRAKVSSYLKTKSPPYTQTHIVVSVDTTQLSKLEAGASTRTPASTKGFPATLLPCTPSSNWFRLTFSPKIIFLLRYWSLFSLVKTEDTWYLFPKSLKPKYCYCFN